MSAAFKVGDHVRFVRYGGGLKFYHEAVGRTMIVRGFEEIDDDRGDATLCYRVEDPTTYLEYLVFDDEVEAVEVTS